MYLECNVEIDDIIKLGRVKYRVSEMKTPAGVFTSQKSLVDTVSELNE